jgi:ABC-type multidrug transport system ATPase subunit
MTSPPRSDSPACCLELRQVAKKYPGSQIFDDLNLRIEPGQIIAILGANGAGKTTLLRLLAGLLTPDQGEIYVTDELLNFARLDLRRKIYFLPDFPPLIGHQTILESIAMVLHLWQKDRPVD